MNADRNSARNKVKTESLSTFLQDKSAEGRPVRVSLIVEHNDRCFEQIMDGSASTMRSVAAKQFKIAKKYQTSKLNGKVVKEHVAFGVSLRKYMQYQQLKNPNVKIPIFLRDAFTYLLRKGLAEEGLFRTDGSKAELRVLRELINSGEHISLEDIKDVALVADIVKQYFQELPEPLILEKFYDTFLAIDELDQRGFQIDTLRKIICVLPSVHQAVLQELLFLFYQVSLNSSVNCMSCENLAIIFSPIMTWKDRSEASGTGENVLNLIKEANKVARVLALAIKEVHALFPAPEPTEEDGCKPPEFTKKLVGHHAAIQAVAVSADSLHVWTGDHLGVIRIWNAESCSFKKDIRPNRGMIFDLVATEKGMWIGTSNALLFIDNESGEIEELGNGPHLALSLVTTTSTSSSSPRTQETIWAGGVGNIRIYSVATKSAIDQILLSSGSKIKALVTDNHTVWGLAANDLLAWDAKTREKIGEVKEAHSVPINDLTLVGESIWTCAGDVGIKIWNRKTLANESQLTLSPPDVLCLTSFGSHVWTGSSDETVRIWDSSTLELLHYLEGFHVDGVSRIYAVWTDRRTKCWGWTASLDATICVWDTAYKAFSK